MQPRQRIGQRPGVHVAIGVRRVSVYHVAVCGMNVDTGRVQVGAMHFEAVRVRQMQIGAVRVEEARRAAD